MTPRLLRHFAVICLAILLGACVTVSQGPVRSEPVQRAPAPRYEALPIDGVWRLAANRVRYRIADGRIVAAEDHIDGRQRVSRGTVLVSQLRRSDEASYVGHDERWRAPFYASLRPDGKLDVRIGSRRPIITEMRPLSLDDRREFEAELAFLRQREREYEKRRRYERDPQYEREERPQRRVRPDPGGDAAQCGGRGQPRCRYRAAAPIQRAGCEAGSFLDPRRGGECWQCPQGAERTRSSVTGSRACRMQARTAFSGIRARHRATGPFNTDCRRGYFLDQASGVCFSCPKGYSRTRHPIDSRKACGRRTEAGYSKARRVGRAACVAPAFDDPRRAGACLQCPPGWQRSRAEAGGKKACVAPVIGTAQRDRKCGRGELRIKGECVRRGECGGRKQRLCTPRENALACQRGLIEDRRRGLCLPSERGELRRDADRVLAQSAPLVEIMRQALACHRASGQMERLKAALRARNEVMARSAVGDSNCFQRMHIVAGASGYNTLTFGIGRDAQLGVGANTELGVAIDTYDRRAPVLYSRSGFALGDQSGAAGALIVGFERRFNSALAADGEGFSFGPMRRRDIGLGVGFDDDKRHQSLSASSAAGVRRGGATYGRHRTVLVTR